MDEYNGKRELGDLKAFVEKTMAAPAAEEKEEVIDELPKDEL